MKKEVITKFDLVVTPTVKGNKILDTPSDYQPSDAVIERLQQIRKDYLLADTIRNKPFREFNYRSLVEYTDDCIDRFINFIEDLTDNDPNESWRANTVRPLTRNKVLEVAAYVTTNIMNPTVIAQNDDADEDTDMATVMEDAMQWTNEQSNYDLNFMYSVIAALVTPCTFLYEGYAEYKRPFKEIQDDGTWKEVEKVDEEFSGFQTQSVPCEELYITDAYESDIQKQPALIWRRIISYEAACIKYGNHPDFAYVKPGIRIFFTEQNGIYEQQSSQLADRNVEEVIYYNRLADLELPIVNGVLLADPDQPIKRKDKKYPFAKTGYGLFDDGRFFYNKSMVDDLKPDQDVADVLINLIVDGAYLRAMPPSVLYGDEAIDTGVLIPGAVFSLQENSRLEQMQVSNDVALSNNILQMIEFNAGESSKRDLVSKSGQTAYTTAQIVDDIKTKLGLFGKMLASLVIQFGRLRLNTIVQVMTVGQIAELTTSDMALKYAKILVSGKMEDGKKRSKKIEFDGQMQEQMTEDEYLMASYKLLAEEGDLDSSKRVIKVNPKLARSMKYDVKIDAQSIFRKSESAKRAEMEALYDRGIQNPIANQKELWSALVNETKPGQAEKFIQEEQPDMMEALRGNPQSGETEPEAPTQIPKQREKEQALL